MIYMYCNYCVEEGARGVYDVCITSTGDLVLTCRKHEIDFLYIPNREASERLREIGMEKCKNCGGECDNEKKVTH